ncbi:hypothetical protein acdb102_11580 [Acidothermaceae bacterium B102]|nr:hypothetical protein acdb102_11580 [Acidothermaceae bacterium B102]
MVSRTGVLPEPTKDGSDPAFEATPGSMTDGGGDTGSASIWMLALALVTLTVAWVVLLVCVAVGVRHRAEAAADLAALAGAAAAQDGADGCVAAARNATANAAELLACAVVADGSISVTVAVRAPPALRRWAAGPVTAQARAGS